MIDINAYQDIGPKVGSRGTSTILVDNFNMKNSSVYATAYFPTNETDSAPLIRPTTPGVQVLSYKVYTYFKLSGTYDWIKNLRFRASLVTAPEASDAQLFFKQTTTYATPDNSFDGNMLLLADKSGVVYSDPIWCSGLSTTGPDTATTRATAYNNVQPLYTPYFVTQIRVNANSLVGNTAEMMLKFECYEYPSGV